MQPVLTQKTKRVELNTSETNKDGHILCSKCTVGLLLCKFQLNSAVQPSGYELAYSMLKKKSPDGIEKDYWFAVNYFFFKFTTSNLHNYIKAVFFNCCY